MRITSILRSKTAQNLAKIHERLATTASTTGKSRRLISFGDNRSNVVSDELCKSIFSKHDFSSYKGGQVIDMNPGTCFFSSYLNNAVKPSKHLLLEPNELYDPFIKDAMEESTNAKSSMTHLRLDGYEWDTWDILFEDKIINNERVPYDQGVNPSLLFTANLPKGLIGERLLNQWLNTVAEKTWLMRYGRVRMLLWMPDSLRKKLAPRLFPNRFKVAALAETVVDLEEIVAPMYEFANLSNLEKFKDALRRIEAKKEAANKSKKSSSETVEAVKMKSKKGRPSKNAKKPVVEADLPENILAWYQQEQDTIEPSREDFFVPDEPYALLSLTPRDVPDFIVPTETDRDRWRMYDYTLRKLFALKTQPVQKAIKSMGPGAETILDTNEELLSMPHVKDKKVNNLTLNEIGAITRAYASWDFRLKGFDIADEWISGDNVEVLHQKQRKRSRMRGVL